MIASARRLLLAPTLAALLIAPAALPASAAALPARPYDFNGDGYTDLAIGAPGESVGSKGGAGAVNVLYGSARGLTALGDQLWSQDTPGVKGTSQGSPYGGSGDSFGSTLASGDFDRDGYADLAIAAPLDRVGAAAIKAGAVNVLYGSKRGLTAAGDQRWSQANLPGSPDWYEAFGDALAAADVDGDGYWDLAIGVPADGVDGLERAGSVMVLTGGPDGLAGDDATVATFESTGSPSEPEASFGRAVALGDLDGDGYPELAVGTAAGGEDGGVVVLNGSADGIEVNGATLWSQETPGIMDGGEKGAFGAQLAIADFDADGFGDLAIGVPNEGPPGWTGYDPGTGAVAVLYGSTDGLVTAGNQLWFPPDGWTPADDDYGPLFGAVLAAGDFDGDGADDLAIGAPQSDLRFGVVIALYGGSGGLSEAGEQLWSQDTPGVPGTTEARDMFGASLAAGDYGRSGRDDLAIGVPGEGAGFTGRITILFGADAGLSAAHAPTWSQDSPGIKDRSESDDEFGATLGGTQR